MRYVVFSRESCPYCHSAIELLEERDEQVKIVSFDDDQLEILQEVKSAYEWGTVPMIFEVNDNAQIKFIGGYTDLVSHFEED
tara:strand:- start:215 stop:460 length:246 start_codon:yes stop_codon:yes gene_type:complete